METDRRGSRTSGWSRSRGITVLGLASVVIISALDGLTSTGAVIGILLVVPIFAVSYSDRPASVWLVFGAAWVGFLLAAFFGPTPGTVDGTIALQNRAFVLLTLGAAAWAALQLQHRRVEAQVARDAAVDSGEVNRLLMSLIAHDLRSPLATALHTLDLIDQTGRADVHADITREVKARLRRSLRVIDAFLAIGAKGRRAGAETGTTFITATQLSSILAEEVRAFEPEATARSKSLTFDAAGLSPGGYTLNVLILRQALAILIDNALRYALPGPVRLHVATSDSAISVTVEDRGPGSSPDRPNGEGAGLGLELCGALLRRSRGELQVDRAGPDGTAFTLRLPIRRAAGIDH